jgi:undecaprenyl-diphosphatase
MAMLLLGAGEVDRAVLLALYAGDEPFLALAALGFTYLGNWPVLVGAAVLVAAWMLYRGKRRYPLLLLIAVFSGRMLIILEKLYFARLRPEENLRLAEVSYHSFPSGHAANSMMVYLGIALLAFEDPAYRRLAVAAALLLSFLIGISRPMLGVHWPSDVVGGWAFGALWLLLVLALADRFWGGKSVAKADTRHSADSD